MNNRQRVQGYAPDSILLIRFSSLGDIILTTPLIRVLKKHWPRAAVDYVTKTEFAGILSGHPGLRRVYEFDPGAGLSGLRSIVGEIRSQNYDMIVDLHVNPRSIYIRLFGGARIIRRYRKRSFQRQLLRSFHVNFLREAGLVLERYFTALEDFTISHDGLGPELFPGADSVKRAKELLGDIKPGNRLVIGLAPGASRATKRWPAERFAEAALKIAGPGEGCVVLLGSRDDLPFTRRVKEALSNMGGLPVLDLTGALGLQEAAAVIRELELLLSNDTALMHMACAVNTPVVAVFGPTSRELGFFPFGDIARVVENNNLECRPCTLHGDARCPEGHFRCMIEIDVEEVVAAANELLSVRKGPA